MKRALKHPFLWLVVVLIIALVLVAHSSKPAPKQDLFSLSEFEQRIASGQINDASFSSGGDHITGRYTNGKTVSRYQVYLLKDDATRVTAELKSHGVEYVVVPQKGASWLSLLGPIIPILILFGIMLFVVNKMAPSGGGIAKFGKARTRVVSDEGPKITFADVAGADEAVADLQEIKDFLAAPAKFQKFGAKIPKGVLLYGPPGTGKTLLARAVAGEAGVPFFSISGSDFVEMFVGVGASRVRDLFEQAKASAPAIVFVDEIDAVGRHRGAGMGGGHDEREQTLNQLLVEMDGFDGQTGVILMAATNRPDVLDPALLRPGRFDRQIVVDRPDIEGRKEILAVHAKDKPIGTDVDLSVIARRTPGFTGADLANVLNEGALLAARRGEETITMSEMEEAIDRVIAGPEKHRRVMSEEEKRVIAYHESGHALVGHLMPLSDPVHKISIVARGRALGWTLSLPTEDKYMHSRAELRARLASLMGGRTSEEVVFGEITTGASDDIEKATEIARSMVTEYGMSDVIGPQKLGSQQDEPFLGRGMSTGANYSDEIAERIDVEMHRILDEAHGAARTILTTNRAVLDRLAQYLIEHETVSQAKFVELVGDLPKWIPSENTVPKPSSVNV